MLPQELARLSFEKMPMPAAVAASEHIRDQEKREIDGVEAAAASLFKAFDRVSNATERDFSYQFGGRIYERSLRDGYVINIDGYQELVFNHEVPELQTLSIPDGYVPMARTSILRYLAAGYRFKDRIYTHNRPVSVMTQIGVAQNGEPHGEWRPRDPVHTGWSIEGVRFVEYFPSTNHQVEQCLPRLSKLEIAEAEALNQAKTTSEIAAGMIVAIERGQAVLGALQSSVVTTSH